ncbi:dihydrolipoamide acetyltransferase family protein [uncultured Pontibacter sp.]|uniref:dihydrolipoamide acetyltransferase family protein n=1 Tax=uncultured Pontibacter sp. TaxID=453356 RepID=UPI002626726C|nr:dihydrolipoamide acetyltransferase family protein [uncultured Pontibacter sp.]
MLEYKMPSLGADMESGFLREWHVKPGDRIRKGDIIAEVETQKGIIEIEVFEEGIIGELLVNLDEQVPVGRSMATILTEEEAASGKAIPAAGVKAPIPETAAQAVPAEEGAQRAEGPAIPEHAPESHHIRASPLAKRVAAEKGIDIATVHGTGPEGAITRDDVEHAIAAQAAPAKAAREAKEEAPAKPAIPKEKTPTPATIPDTKAEVASPSIPEPAAPIPTAKASASADTIRMAVAAAMGKSNREIPHYYLETKIDMSKALAWLSETNKQRPVKERLLPAALLIKAVAKALNDIPELNATWENGLQRKELINVGYVVALRTGGIMVPTIHETDTKTLDEIMQALNDLIPRARALRLRSSELADSTITVTSLGEAGVEVVYGVIYPPQVALVGFGGITEQPWSENGMLTVRPILTATLAADHRASDGSTGSKFLTAIKNYLQQPDKL